MNYIPFFRCCDTLLFLNEGVFFFVKVYIHQNHFMGYSNTLDFSIHQRS